MKTRQILFLILAIGGLAIAGAQKAPAPKVGEVITEAAEKLLAALSEEERTLATVDFDSGERVKWHFIPLEKRKGLELNLIKGDAEKLIKVRDLLKAVLSTRGSSDGNPDTGYAKAKSIMKLEAVLAELEADKKSKVVRDPFKYYVTFFGKPAKDTKWGFSFEGHHLSLNFVIENSKVISTTPMMFGANPATVKADFEKVGIKTGFRVLSREEDLAFEFLASLNAKQRREAVISEKAPSEIRDAATPQPPTTKAEGVSGLDLRDNQKSILRNLIKAHADSLPPVLAKERRDAVEIEGFHALRFAWAGATEPGKGHYYRIQGPTILIEFINVQPDAAGNTANHIHTVWRDMRGDFAIDIPKTPKKP